VRHFSLKLRYGRKGIFYFIGEDENLQEALKTAHFLVAGGGAGLRFSAGTFDLIMTDVMLPN
jgi:molybdopterin/thiamine biosynthesis adenylyltransferase